MSEECQARKEDSESFPWSSDDQQVSCVPDEGHQDFFHSSDEASSSRTKRTQSSRTGNREGSHRSGYGPSSEDEEENKAELYPLNPSTTSKKFFQKGPKGQNRVGHLHRRSRAPFLPPIRLSLPDVPLQRVTSAQDLRIKQLGSQVRNLQQQLDATCQENRLLRHLHSRNTVALQRFQDSQASLPQMLQKHSREVHALQELLRSCRTRNGTLRRSLRVTETELLHACDALRRLQRLSQDHNMEEREKLTKHLNTLATELQTKNRRIQDLEKNLTLSNAYFNRQLKAEIRKTMEAQELARALEEQISNLTQKVKEMEKELEVHNIYSHRFLKGASKRGPKVSKTVQTDAGTPLPLKGPGPPLEMQYPQDQPKALEKHSWEFYRNETTDGGSGEEGLQTDREEMTEHKTFEDGRDSAVPKLEYSTDAQEANAKPSQASPSGRPTSAEGRNLLVFKPSPSATSSRSPGMVRRHYTFKETIQNVHNGKPAYRNCRPQNTPVLLDTGMYEPYLLPAAQIFTLDKTWKDKGKKELLGPIQTMEVKPKINSSESAELD